jgi:hypothetical protein
MSIRYEDATSDVMDLAREVIAEHFPELRSVKIKYIFDLKKRVSGGMNVLARCQKSNDLLKFLTIDESGDEEGYVYIVYVDKLLWENIERTDKIRLLRHEFRHIYVDTDAVKNPYKLVDHDVSDFREEIALNTDDPRWDERLSTLASDLYDQREEMEEGE